MKSKQIQKCHFEIINVALLYYRPNNHLPMLSAGSSLPMAARVPLLRDQ